MNEEHKKYIKELIKNSNLETTIESVYNKCLFKYPDLESVNKQNVIKYIQIEYVINS